MPRLTLKSPPVFVGPISEYSEPDQKKIAIVGAHPALSQAAPFEDKEWEIWVFSRGGWKNNFFRRWDKWFEIHNPKKFPRYEMTEWKGYTQFLQDTKAITWETGFPRDQLIDRFGTWFFRGGQAPWLIAYAITLNPPEIGLWGIEAIGDYKPQRYCIQHFIQLARDAGIKVTVTEGCTLLEEEKFYE